MIELFFNGVKGVFMGSIMGSQNIMGLDYGSNISGPSNRKHALLEWNSAFRSLQRNFSVFTLIYWLEVSILGL